MLIPAQLLTVRRFGVGSGLIGARGRSRAFVLLYTVVVVVVVGARVPFAHRSVVTSLRSVVVVASATVVGDPPLQLDETRASSFSMRVSRTGSYRGFLSFIVRRPSSTSPRSRSRPSRLSAGRQSATSPLSMRVERTWTYRELVGWLDTRPSLWCRRGAPLPRLN